MSTEEMIKQAFDKQADRAGDHRRVLAEVARATSSRRRIGAVGIALLATGVAAAVVTPVVLFTGGGEPASVQPAVTAAPAVPPGTPVLKFVPGWLPDEMVEDLREFLADGSLVRGWSVPGTGSGPENGGGQQIELKFEKVDKLTKYGAQRGMQPVDINGNPGQVSGDDGPQPRQSIVEWLVGNEGRLTLRVDRMPDAKTLALSVARSVRADSDAAFVRSVTFGWLPEGVIPGSYSVRGTDKPQVIAESGSSGNHTDSTYPKSVHVQIDRGEPIDVLPGPGTAVTVRGRQGMYRTRAEFFSTAEILVEIMPGQWLRARSTMLGKDELVKVVDGLILVDNPKFAWLGR